LLHPPPKKKRTGSAAGRWACPGPQGSVVRRPMLEGAQAHRKETKTRGSDVRHAGTRGEVWQHGLVRSAELKNTQENTSHDATLEQAWTSVDRQHRCSAITHQIVAIVVVGRVVSSHGAPVVVRAVMQTHARKHKHTHKPSQTGYLSRGSSSCRTAGDSKDYAHNTVNQRTLCVFPTIGVPDTSFRL
jgi:hypothetical protein